MLTKGTKLLIVAVVALIVVIIGMTLGYNWEMVTTQATGAARRAGLFKTDVFGGIDKRRLLKAELNDDTPHPTPDDDMRDARNDIRGDGQPVYDTVQPDVRVLESSKGDMIKIPVRLDTPVYVKPDAQFFTEDIRN
jgi:hypothetical protein